MSRRHKGEAVEDATKQERRAHAKAERQRVRAELGRDPEADPGVEWKPPKHHQHKPQPGGREKQRKFWKNKFWKRRSTQRQQRARQLRDGE